MKPAVLSLLIVFVTLVPIEVRASHVPSADENVRVDPNLQRLLLIEALKDALMHVFCVGVSPSSLGCFEPPGAETAEAARAPTSIEEEP